MTFRDFLARGEPLGLKLTDSGHALLGRNPKPLRQRCAWCKKLIRDGALTPEGFESHGVCNPPCAPARKMGFK